MYRMNQIVKMIRLFGSADIILEGETVTVGFVDAGKSGELIMVNGGHYVVYAHGRKFNIAKGQLISLA